jgi:hypothetical protein
MSLNDIIYFILTFMYVNIRKGMLWSSSTVTENIQLNYISLERG